MKGRLHFVSPKGSAAMVATEIGKEVQMIPEALPPAYMPENVMLMFLGCEGGKADKITLEFIKTLTPKRVANAALYCCNAKKNDAAIQQMKDALVAQGIKVLSSTLMPCAGCAGHQGAGQHFRMLWQGPVRRKASRRRRAAGCCQVGQGVRGQAF